ESATIANPVTRVRFGRRHPIAQLDGIDFFQWWALTNEALARLMRAAGFARVERGKTFELPATTGGSWRGRRGVVRGYVCACGVAQSATVLARALPTTSVGAELTSTAIS